MGERPDAGGAGYVKRFAVVAVAALSLSTPSVAGDDLSFHHFLSVAKIAGACGILDSMIQFQTGTKMEGGDKFVLRFWETEAARLGKTVPELAQQCNDAVSTYDLLWQAGQP